MTKRPPKTKALPRAYFASPHSYAAEQKETLLAILRPHLLSAYRNVEGEGAIMDEIQEAVSLLSASKEPYRGWPERDRLTTKQIANIRAACARYVSLLQTVNEETAAALEDVLTSNSQTMALRKEAERLGFPSYPDEALPDIIEHVLEVNDYLLHLLCLLPASQTNHRPQDEIMRKTVIYLCAAYKQFTGKPVRIGGTLQRFVEAAIAPIDAHRVAGVRAVLQRLKKQRG